MKAAIRLITFLIIIFAFFAWLNNAVLWPWTGIRYVANSEYVCAARWTAHGYDSWGIEYSYGRQFQSNGTLKNLWHFPTWRRAHWKFSIVDVLIRGGSGCKWTNKLTLRSLKSWMGRCSRWIEILSWQTYCMTRELNPFVAIDDNEDGIAAVTAKQRGGVNVIKTNRRASHEKQ